jgi:hypothetical protein
MQRIRTNVTITNCREVQLNRFSKQRRYRIFSVDVDNQENRYTTLAPTPRTVGEKLTMYGTPCGIYRDENSIFTQVRNVRWKSI